MEMKSTSTWEDLNLGGQYHPLLAMDQMVVCVVLNFTQESVKKQRPGMSFAIRSFWTMMSNTEPIFLEHKKLYHVQFSQDLREVQILHSSLEKITDFTLSERRNPLFH